MRQIAVRHAAVLLACVLLASAGVFTWLVGRSGSPPDAATPSTQPAQEAPGAALFEAYCASCHQADQLRPDVHAPSGRHDLELFLRDHGRASDADDRLILDYLESGGTGAPESSGPGRGQRDPGRVNERFAVAHTDQVEDSVEAQRRQ